MSTQFKIVHSINDVDEKSWNHLVRGSSPFLETSFLKAFEINNDSSHLVPFYISWEKGIIYGHLIKIDGQKVGNYLNSKKYSLKKLFLNQINLQFFCFGNTHLSNVSSVSFKNNKLSEHDFNSLTNQLKKEFKINFFLFPDYFLNRLDFDKSSSNYMSSEFKIDPDMVLKLNSKWSLFDDYKNSVSSKYKKRISNVLNKSKDLVIRKIESEKIESFLPILQNLYDNVHGKSSFSGAPMNIGTFKDLLNQSAIEFSIFGYFLNSEIIAFSSEFFINKSLYSYFIGLNYQYNKNLSLYNRILYDSIERGIKKKAEKIIYGRTASEFKSTIGAIPLESKIAVHINNKLLRFLTYPIIKKISPKKWIQRNPFKTR